MNATYAPPGAITDIISIVTLVVIRAIAVQDWTFFHHQLD